MLYKRYWYIKTDDQPEYATALKQWDYDRQCIYQYVDLKHPAYYRNDGHGRNHGILFEEICRTERGIFCKTAERPGNCERLHRRDDERAEGRKGVLSWRREYAEFQETEWWVIYQRRQSEYICQLLRTDQCTDWKYQLCNLCDRRRCAGTWKSRRIYAWRTGEFPDI